MKAISIQEKFYLDLFLGQQKAVPLLQSWAVAQLTPALHRVLVGWQEAWECRFIQMHVPLNSFKGSISGSSAILPSQSLLPSPVDRSQTSVPLRTALTSNTNRKYGGVPQTTLRWQFVEGYTELNESCSTHGLLQGENTVEKLTKGRGIWCRV
jgi:hypothetical protein